MQNREYAYYEFAQAELDAAASAPGPVSQPDPIQTAAVVEQGIPGASKIKIHKIELIRALTRLRPHHGQAPTLVGNRVNAPRWARRYLAQGHRSGRRPLPVAP